MAYSIDFREKILDVYVNKEGTNEEIAERFKVSIATVKGISRCYKETGKVEMCLDNIGRPMKLDEAGIRTLQDIVNDHADSTYGPSYYI